MKAGTGGNRILTGHWLEIAPQLPNDSVQVCITSPPYWSLRDFGAQATLTWPDGWVGQLGSEPTPELYIAHLVRCFDEVHRVLRPDGVVWIVIGDSYAGSGVNDGTKNPGLSQAARRGDVKMRRPSMGRVSGLKPKDLVGIPFMLAFALRARGWYWRSNNVWHKPNAKPESVRDRCTVDFETVLMLSKSRHYYYDQEAVRQPYAGPLNRRGGDRRKGVTPRRQAFLDAQRYGVTSALRAGGELRPNPAGRHLRAVWSIPTQAYGGAHFATFPEKLVRPMILAASSPSACPICGAPWKRILTPVKGVRQADREAEKQAKRKTGAYLKLVSPAPSPTWIEKYHTEGWEPTCACSGNDGSGKCVVLDPFCGSGVVGKVALALGRTYIMADVNPDYVKLAHERIEGVQMEMV